MNGRGLLHLNPGSIWLIHMVLLREPNKQLLAFPSWQRPAYRAVLRDTWKSPEDARREATESLRRMARTRGLRLVEVSWQELKTPDSYELGVLAFR